MVLKALGLFQKFFRAEPTESVVWMHSTQLDALFRFKAQRKSSMHEEGGVFYLNTDFWPAAQTAGVNESVPSRMYASIQEQCLSQLKGENS